MDMKILVTKGMISYNRKLHKVNQIVEVDEAAGRRFIRLGVATLLEETVADAPAAGTDEPVTPEQQPEDAEQAADEAEEEETVADLPTVDPAAGVKKASGKKKAAK
ncbi:hypothetical protein SAMN05216366_104132 [Selenomonas ruminantium]|uniref:Uncharacterized protein n=2 Tax=Selenomonas ruminantium TaxID=971 RepID=A0A1H0P781_SELRU|nr:hypothetical protein SAMN05216366_104132 [Selenomonas ruminantium]